MNNPYEMKNIYLDCYNNVNQASNFKGVIDRIIDKSLKELEQIRMMYQEQYQSEMIKQVLNQAEKELKSNRDTFIKALKTELDKEIQKIPENLNSKNYTDIDFKLLEYQMKSMTNEEILQFAKSNITDQVAVVVAKGILCDRANLIEDKNEKQNLIQVARMLNPLTKEQIVRNIQSEFSQLVNNPSDLYPGENLGRSASISAQGGIIEVICRKANIDKAKNLNPSME